MKKNVLSLFEVMDVSKQLMKAVKGQEYVSADMSLSLLNDDGLLDCYKTHFICKESEKDEAEEKLKKLGGLTKKEFIKQNPYCHISTYPLKEAGYYMVSFDMNDDEPCKVQFSEGYEYLNYFFYKFNNMRNDLIDKNEVVKDDDIYQYLYIVLESNKKNKEENKEIKKSDKFKDNKVKTLIKRFINK